MQKFKQQRYFVSPIRFWTLPRELSDFRSYGLWNSLSACDPKGELIEIIPAHDGDFFPESPFDHIELLRGAVLSGRNNQHSSFWPVRVDIDITQRCTGNCPFCYSRIYAFNPEYRNAEISAATLEAILEQLAEGGTRSIRFTGGGEPLVHPDIEKILPMPKKYGLRSCVITNGHILDDEISELLVSNIDHIRISFNAAKNTTRQNLHRPETPGNDLRKILQQMSYMVQLRDTIWPSQKRPLIWATFILLPENVNEVYLAAQLVKDCGIDSISFRPVYHNLSRQFYIQEFETLHRQLKLALTLHSPPAFQVFAPNRDITTVWDISPKTQFPRCISCHLRTIIEATNLGPMIKVCGLHRGIGRDNLGLLKKGTRFSDLWNRDETRKILSNQVEICERCIDISMNITLNKVWEVLVKHPEASFQKSWYRTPNSEKNKGEGE